MNDPSSQNANQVKGLGQATKLDLDAYARQLGQAGLADRDAQASKFIAGLAGDPAKVRSERFASADWLIREIAGHRRERVE